MALKQLKNHKADGITAELRGGGTPVLKPLLRLFSAVVLGGQMSQAWHRGVVVLFFKNGDKTTEELQIQHVAESCL